MTAARRLVVGLVTAGMTVGPIGCATRPQVEPLRSKQEVLDVELSEAAAIEQDEKRKEDQVDQRLRVASMAWDVEQPELARENLVEATSFMAALTPEKDFHKRAESATRLLGDKEREKYFLGDPHEQLFAYLYLGILDFQAGDYGKALGSFRSAHLADEGSRAEGYKSDCYLALLLEGVTCRMLDDEPGMDEAFRLAERAFAFRQRMPLLKEAFYMGAAEYLTAHSGEKDQERLDALFPLVFGQLPIALTADLEPHGAVDQAFGGARLLLEEEDRRERSDEAKDVLKRYSGKTDEALEDLGALQSLVLSNITDSRMAATLAAERAFGALIERCNAPETNAFILHQVGAGPAKIRLGKYGQIVQIRPNPCALHRVVTTVRRLDGAGGSPMLASISVLGESVDYQASTRGGREMDHILEGRAKFRDAMNVSATLSGTVASAALCVAMVQATTAIVTTTTVVTPTATAAGSAGYATTTTTTTSTAGVGAATTALAVAGAAFLLYQGSKILSDAAHPEGDVRGWHELPSRIFFTCAALEPGEYELRSEYFDVVARQLPERSTRIGFVVEQGHPSMVLAGSPWDPQR